jgi:hypothetical protein
MNEFKSGREKEWGMWQGDGKGSTAGFNYGGMKGSGEAHRRVQRHAFQPPKGDSHVFKVPEETANIPARVISSLARPTIVP